MLYAQYSQGEWESGLALLSIASKHYFQFLSTIIVLKNAIRNGLKMGKKCFADVSNIVYCFYIMPFVHRERSQKRWNEKAHYHELAHKFAQILHGWSLCMNSLLCIFGGNSKDRIQLLTSN